MTESQARQALDAWSRILCGEKIPYAVIGSAAMLLHRCQHGRDSFKDVDFWVPTKRKNEFEGLLVGQGYSRNKNGNYEKDETTIGIATPKSHNGLPDPSDDGLAGVVDGIRVLSLDQLIRTKMLAVEGQMKKIESKGYRRPREASAIKQLDDFFVLCHTRDKMRASNAPPEPRRWSAAEPE